MQEQRILLIFGNVCIKSYGSECYPFLSSTGQIKLFVYIEEHLVHISIML